MHQQISQSHHTLDRLCKFFRYYFQPGKFNKYICICTHGDPFGCQDVIADIQGTE